MSCVDGIGLEIAPVPQYPSAECRTRSAWSSGVAFQMTTRGGGLSASCRLMITNPPPFVPMRIETESRDTGQTLTAGSPVDSANRDHTPSR